MRSLGRAGYAMNSLSRRKREREKDKVIAMPSSFCFFFYKSRAIVVGEERNRGN
jgi:hypothetical protein